MRINKLFSLTIALCLLTANPTFAQTLPPPDLEQAVQLSTQAAERQKANQLPEATELTRQALALRLQALPPGDAQIAKNRWDLGFLLSLQRNFSEAKSFYEQAMADYQAIPGSEKEIGGILSNLGVLYRETREYVQAEEVLRRADQLLTKALGSDDPEVAKNLNRFGNLYLIQGRFQEAEPLFERSFQILEKAKPGSPELAVSLNNLGGLYYRLGYFSEAKALHEKAVAIWEKFPASPNLGAALLNLGGDNISLRKFDEAESILLRALAVREKIFPPGHPDIAQTLSNLGLLYLNTGRYDQAETAFKRTSEIFKATKGEEDPDYVVILTNLAVLDREQGRFSAAEGRFAQAVQLLEKISGPNHPLLSEPLQQWSVLEIMAGNTDKAQQLLQRVTEVEEYNLNLTITSGTEQQKREVLATLQKSTDTILWAHLQQFPNDHQMARRAFTTLVRRKGRLLDALSDGLNTLRRNGDSETRTGLEELVAVRKRLSEVALQRSPETATVPALLERQQKLESELGKRSAAFRAEFAPVTLEDVRAQIPTGAMLLEFALYHPRLLKDKHGPDQYADAHYAVYLLDREGHLQWSDLGEAKQIDEAVEAVRKTLRSRESTSAAIQSTARNLDRLLMAPLRSKLGKTRQLLISTDGALNLLPFAALVDANKRFLVETYTVSYLGTGRDLLRFDTAAQPQSPPLVLAAPDFDATNPKSQVATNLRSFSFQSVPLQPLPGTHSEAQVIGKLLPKSRILLGSAANESALKNAHSPALLHIATHGFFLKPAELGNRQAAENPLLRSGLALAGFNRRGNGAEDGVLTSLEVSSLDLAGTQLVVLSACDTGLGEVENGEGVYGLRRALVLAGTHAQVLSLWKVEDRATEALINAFYRQLVQHKGPAAALRNAQLQMLRNPRFSLPFYWAAFIPAGNWRPLTFLNAP